VSSVNKYEFGTSSVIKYEFGVSSVKLVRIWYQFVFKLDLDMNSV
jgi:hypothetical protein